ncbi:MAG: hypothetical protein ACOYMG_14145 [Candidatus Methylumidiphilus sp.]
MEKRVIHKGLDEIGGSCAYSEIPVGYEGKCAIFNGGCFPEKEMAVFPSRQEAESAARYAITPDGGYSEVIAKVADKSSQITHQSWIDWLAG